MVTVGTTRKRSNLCLLLATDYPIQAFSSRILKQIERRSPEIAKQLNIEQALKEGVEAPISAGESGVKEETEEVEKEKKGFFAKILKKKGIPLLILWEHEINQNLNYCYKKIKKFVDKYTVYY